jgi:hypothetical protein
VVLNLISSSSRRHHPLEYDILQPRRIFAKSFQDSSGRVCANRPRSPESLESQVIVHRDLDILFRAKIAFGGLDGGVPEQELDLLEIAAALAAEFGAGAAQIMGAEVLDPDLLR